MYYKEKYSTIQEMLQRTGCAFDYNDPRIKKVKKYREVRFIFGIPKLENMQSSLENS